MDAVTERGFSVRLDCHYLLKTPDLINDQNPLVLALHGFGADPESMLRLTGRLFSIQPVIASLQAPYQFFLQSSGEVGFGWITNRHPAESIRLHHDMVSHVLNEVGLELGIPPARRLLVGFSQSVSLNYRFAANSPDAVRGIIAICGGLPSDWETGAYRPITAAVLHIARRQDDYYPPNVTERYPEQLRQRASDVEFHLLDGGHQMPSSGSSVVAPWVHRILT
jgi:phospholipase/carboxylesterase